MLRENIQGHIIEQNSPPDKKAYVPTIPVFNRPIIMARIASKLNIIRLFTGLSCENK